MPARAREIGAVSENCRRREEKSFRQPSSARSENAGQKKITEKPGTGQREKLEEGRSYGPGPVLLKRGTCGGIRGRKRGIKLRSTSDAVHAAGKKVKRPEKESATTRAYRRGETTA